ncbi:M20/M25/M40 family metallo-hydrolase [uncultured Catenibacterium sp.]|uniref:M20/M25/M40 family metallo-hydrolase n=1 Tax=uncultured Catenibacterium sp. TaxID=286142 RepID=UPI0025F65DDA|nr:M20/M25/M40 family metallo-hydrolase [uncultured Catenibacterium sp.]
MMINKERLVQTFCEMVSIDSESYHEKQMKDYLMKVFKECHMECIEMPIEGFEAGNIYAVLKGSTNKEPVMFSGHMDTVSPGNGKHAILHEDGRITSDGTTVLGADDVSALASYIEAIRTIEERNIPHGDIELAISVAEEPYDAGSAYYDFSRIKSRIGYTFDLAGEVGLAALEAPSIISFKISVKGKSAHAGFNPEDGIHALKIASNAISRIPNGHVNNNTTVNFGTITGGEGRNIVPREVILTGEIRSFDHQDALKWSQHIKTIFEEEATKEHARIEYSDYVHIEAYKIDEDEEVVERFKRACEELNLAPKLISTHGGSDNNRFVKVGIRGIVVACAMNDCHSVSEYTTIDELEKSTQLALHLMID